MNTNHQTIKRNAAENAGLVRASLIVLTGVCMIPSLMVVAVASFFTVSSTTAHLRDAVLETNPAQKRVAVSAGPITCALARYALGFLELPPEARLGIASARGGEVCVYQLDQPARPAERGRIIRRADIAMTKRGWSRVVGVSHENNLVAVYMPQKQRSSSDVRACVLVLHERDMVVAAARGKVEPILDLAAMHCDLPGLPVLATSR